MCVLAEKDKISVYDLEISKNTAMLLPDLQKNTHIIPSLLYQIPHEKSIITNIKALKKSRLLMLGDANFGFEMFSVGQGGAQGKHRGHRLFIRELEMFEFNGKMKILAVDENMNLYFYSLLQGDKCEKIADLHLPSRISKLIGRSENQKTQVKFWAGFLDGNIREINMAQHQKIRFLQVFQDIIFEELPFYAGMHPQEIRSIQNYKADNTMKARQGIADLKFLDTLFNMSRPLQKVFYNKTLQGREGIVSFIKDTLEQKK
ncbi:WD40-repeat-containing domain [Pseudocohnilembus persalinus]|uniref:WD40-repeat-containing domain n=1 Tax=Pseudocohnilembus persalinus TaxID=266149 RepID=A0A0V0QCB9_PSEPJ|nr:WD40-repeat-containing domain [Pseudocohnilembus persalinus]|eukprot:KRW99840.1 WD40-repeat-containing domain [Pseudocohnilembus persalinus]